MNRNYHVTIYLQMLPALAIYSTLHLLPINRNIVVYEKIFNQEYLLWQYFGVMVIWLGISIFIVYFKTLGVRNIFFINDYSNFKKDKLIVKSIYRYIRHPLVLGSFFISLGIIMFTCNDTTSYIIFANNLIFLGPYKMSEDKRMIGIYGNEYEQYMKITGAYFPRIKFLF